jgi:hypothetical protein
MTIAEIIEQADIKTERRKPKELDAHLCLLQVIQDYCKAHRFSWRRRSNTFSTTAATSTYDLSSSTLLNRKDVEEIISVRYVKSVSDVQKLDFIEDAESVEEIQSSTTTGEPAAWAFDPTNPDDSILISPVPAGTYTMRVTYWAVPDLSDNESATDVPLVPRKNHSTLQKLLETEFWRVIHGPENPKYQTAKANSDAAVEQDIEKARGTTRHKMQWLDDEDSVRSTS